MSNITELIKICEKLGVKVESKYYNNTIIERYKEAFEKAPKRHIDIWRIT